MLLHGFPALLLLPFYEAFSIPVNNEKYGEGHNQNFTSNNLFKKKPEHPFVKKADL